MRRYLIFLLSIGCGDLAITEYEPRNGLITGTLLFQSPVASSDVCTPVPTGGNAVITLFALDRPPPPAGTSGPVNFIVVPEGKLFGEGSQGGGLFAAPFTIPTVPSGRYTVRGFLDADEDFRPTVPLLAQPTSGDVVGAHIDPATRQIRTVDVALDRVTPQVTVTLALPIAAERPAFAITSTPTFSVPYATPETLVIESHPINTTDVKMAPECTRFLVSYVDENADGTPDDQNGDHLPDLYPRVLLRLRDRMPGEPDIVIPAIINPLPFLDRLLEATYVPTTILELLLPPVAVERGPLGNTIIPIPAGQYDTIVISGTGQTWQVPNDLAQVQPNDPPDATQVQVVTMSPGPPPPNGAITGTVRTAEAMGDVYVIAFDANDPPPPQGSGRPRGLATVASPSFVPNGTQREAPFAIRGLPNGTYQVIAVLDADGDLSPLVDLVAQPSQGDAGGRAMNPVVVNGGEIGGVNIDIATPFLFDRPAFEHDGPSIPRTAFPAILKTRAHAIDALGIDLESARVPVALGGTDLEGDNLPDLLPRVVLTQIADEGDPRTAPDTGVWIPGIVDPLPWLSSLGGGAPFVPGESLRIILPPVALFGTERIAPPPPPGRYRVNVLSVTGQTWSVPSELDLILGRAGTAREDATQSAYVTIEDTPLPQGAITGNVRLLAATPPGEYQVVVLAFALGNPPPPKGSGRPVGIDVVRSDEFNGGVATYAVGGLPTATYQLRAFLDANDDFVPWFDTMNQPDGGDVGGGHLQLPQGVLLPVSVDALGPPATDIEVSIVDALELPTDRPSFWISTPSPVLDLSQGPVSVAVDALRETTDILDTEGVFPIKWIDLNGDSVADDVNRDGNPDVYPIVVAELLDPNDEENLTLSTPPVRLPGMINPGQFAPLGFPENDPTQLGVVVLATTLTVVFPAIAIPEGRYRITLINPAGQTWTIPNELERAVGSPFVGSQGGYLTVRP